MYKAIIADDEKKICKLILALGNWEEYGIKVVDVCYHGNELWDSIRRNKPDIVITDIRMPGIDGLEIISKINGAFGPENGMKFIIISGYAKFEYAKQAIQYDIVNYLLKPINKIQLNDALQKACSSLNAKQLQKDNEKDLRKIREANCIDQLCEKQPVTLQFLNQTYGTAFCDGCFFGMFITFSSLGGNTNLYDIILDAIRLQRPKFQEIVIKAKDDTVQCVFNLQSGEKYDFQDLAIEIKDELSKVSEKFNGLYFFIGIGNLVNDINAVYSSLINAEIVEKSRIFFPRENIFFAGWKTDQVLDSVEIFSIFKITELGKFIEKLSETDIKKWFQNTLKMFCENNFGCRELDLIEKKLFYFYTKLSDMLPSNNAKELQNALKGASGINDYFYVMDAFFIKTIRNVSAEVASKENQPVTYIKNYVYSHYDKPLFLTDIAEKMSYNSIYLGNMFKRETGMTFTEFLNNVRMEKAKELLRNSNLSIQEVAAHTGYSDVKYFRKIFRKAYNMKPLEYRRLTSMRSLDNKRG